jgi:hypothetical protein
MILKLFSRRGLGARKFWKAQADVSIVIVNRQGTPILDDSFLAHFLLGLMYLSWILSPQKPKLISVTRLLDLKFLHRGYKN